MEAMWKAHRSFHDYVSKLATKLFKIPVKEFILLVFRSASNCKLKQARCVKTKVCEKLKIDEFVEFTNVRVCRVYEHSAGTDMFKLITTTL